MRRIAKEELYRYLEVSSRDRLWDIYLNAAGRILHRTPGTPDNGHPAPYYYEWNDGRRLPGFGIGYVTQGQGEFESETAGHHVIDAGTLFLLFPNEWHRYRPLSNTNWSYHWLHVDGGYLAHLMKHQLISPTNPLLQVGLNGQVLRPFLSLAQRMKEDPPALQQLAAGNVLEILGSALAAPSTPALGSELESILRTARATLEEQVYTAIDLKRLAQSLGLSYDYFRRLFREQFGISPYQYYLNLRLERAKELLCGTDMTIQEIALSLQFDTQNYFARIFKKKTSMSPTDWRTVSRQVIENASQEDVENEGNTNSSGE